INSSERPLVSRLPASSAVYVVEPETILPGGRNEQGKPDRSFGGDEHRGVRRARGARTIDKHSAGRSRLTSAERNYRQWLRAEGGAIGRRVCTECRSGHDSGAIDGNCV